jgi:hypothetical protein
VISMGDFGDSRATNSVAERILQSSPYSSASEQVFAAAVDTIRTMQKLV